MAYSDGLCLHTTNVGLLPARQTVTNGHRGKYMNDGCKRSAADDGERPPLDTKMVQLARVAAREARGSKSTWSAL